MQPRRDGSLRLQHHINVDFRTPTQDCAFETVPHFPRFSNVISIHHVTTSFPHCLEAIQAVLGFDFHKTTEYSDFLYRAGVEECGLVAVHNERGSFIFIGRQATFVAFQVLFDLVVRGVDQFCFAFCEHNNTPFPLPPGYGEGLRSLEPNRMILALVC